MCCPARTAADAVPVRLSGAEQAGVAARLRAAGCVYAEEEAGLLAAAAGSAAELDALVARRAAGQPLEHVVGWAEFCGLRIAVDPGVFVPRRRTEFLVAQAALCLPGGATPRNPPPSARSAGTRLRRTPPPGPIPGGATPRNPPPSARSAGTRLRRTPPPGPIPGGRPPGTPRHPPARRGHACGAPRLPARYPGGRPPGTPGITSRGAYRRRPVLRIRGTGRGAGGRGGASRGARG